MTTPMRIQGIIEIDPSGAVRGIEVTEDQLQALGGTVARVKRQLAAMGDTAGGPAARGLSRASGAMANLTAQGNDVITMAIAGQAPLQLMMQQGTQIAQIFSGRTMGQAFRMTRGAIASMISPMNLLTLGLVAGTAAIIQWIARLGEAGDEADDLADRVGGALDRIAALTVEVRALRLGVSDEELALRDDIAARREAIAAREAEIAAAKQAVRRAAAWLVPGVLISIPSSLGQSVCTRRGSRARTEPRRSPRACR